MKLSDSHKNNRRCDWQPSVITSGTIKPPWVFSWQCCTTLRFLQSLSGHRPFKEDRGHMNFGHHVCLILFRNSTRSLLGHSVVAFKVDRWVKDLLCLIWLDTGGSQTGRHFLVLWVRDVDAGIVKVILIFYWSSLCCRSWAIGQSWDVVILRIRKWLLGSEHIRLH